jgi:hypothetical protein
VKAASPWLVCATLFLPGLHPTRLTATDQLWSPDQLPLGLKISPAPPTRSGWPVALSFWAARRGGDTGE